MTVQKRKRARDRVEGSAWVKEEMPFWEEGLEEEGLGALEPMRERSGAQQAMAGTGTQKAEPGKVESHLRNRRSESQGSSQPVTLLGELLRLLNSRCYEAGREVIHTQTGVGPCGRCTHL